MLEFAFVVGACVIRRAVADGTIEGGARGPWDVAADGPSLAVVSAVHTLELTTPRAPSIISLLLE